jgi:hypothetical protein
VGEVESLSLVSPFECHRPIGLMLTLPLVSCGLIAGQVSDWAASESRFMTMVDLPIASSMSKRFLPGTQPSSSASFQEAPFFRTPTMTFRPLSRRLRPWPWPWEP